MVGPACHNARMLSVRGLSVEVGGRLTLENATFTLRAGEKVGLVGRNGAGKTSLLRVLSGEAPAAAGVAIHKGALGYLPQDPRPEGSGVDSTGLSHILSGRGFDEAQRRIEKLRLRVDEEPSDQNVARFTKAEDEFRMAGGYAAEGEVRRIAAGLGLSGSRLDLPITALSGGERRRVELGRILYAGSDLLLLDEPTNHLDVDAKTWLLGYMRTYKGALLVVSHDLLLLDEAITRVLHIDAGTMVEYKGTYSQYKGSRKKDEERQVKVAARQQSEISRLKSLADSMRGQTENRAKTAKALDTRVARLQDGVVSIARSDKVIQPRFPDPPRAGETVLRVDQLCKGFGGPSVFDDVTFDVGRGERMFVMGLNGAGKTTLMRILAGVTEADLGVVEPGHNVSVGYYAQEHEGIVPGRDLLWHMREAAAGAVGDQTLRALLGMFGLSGEMAFQDSGTLSGGEKTKLALAQLVCGRHNVLLLDEPTNNLDPPSRTAIGDALSRWPGSIVLVSHDTEFVHRMQPQRVLMMPEGELDYWSDDLLELVALA